MRTTLPEAKPCSHCLDIFTLSNAPKFRDKLIDVVRLYTNPLENAGGLCKCEETEVQAFGQTRPNPPMHPDKTERHIRTCMGNGTRGLCATLDLEGAKVQADCQDRHRPHYSALFLRNVIRWCPDVYMCGLLNNVSSNESESAKRYCGVRHREHIRTAPAYSSWLKPVEMFFALTQTIVQVCGIFPSASDRVAKPTVFPDNSDNSVRRSRFPISFAKEV
ncbi:MAG: hypothetical protein NTU41_13140 [Chloroflexi bacterium]|nr:hypothetical protein [Chloroflexota bacterium]